MNLEEIITAAVEKRVSEMVEQAMSKQSNHWGDETPTGIERIVLQIIDGIAKEEIKKHEDILRASVVKALHDSPISFEVSAHSQIKFPPQPKDRYSL